MKKVRKMKKKQLLIGLIVFSVLSTNISVYAYELTSWRWVAGKRNPLYYYENDTPWSEFDDAEDAWNDEETDFGDFQSIGNPEYAWVTTQRDDENEGWTGYVIVISTGGWADAADMHFNDHHYSTLGSDGRETVCAHEMGHIFSLDDENDIWVLMHQGALDRVARGILGPQTDDIDGVNDAY